MNTSPLCAWGDERLWCDETLHQLLAVSSRHVAAQGYAHVMVWSRENGEVASRARASAR